MMRMNKSNGHTTLIQNHYDIARRLYRMANSVLPSIRATDEQKKMYSDLMNAADEHQRKAVTTGTQFIMII